MIRGLRLFIIVFSTSWASVSSAEPYKDGKAPFGATAAFDVAALSDTELSLQNAMALPATQRYRVAADQYSVGTLQRIGQSSRIALDNWWAQNGAALVANSVLSR